MTTDPSASRTVPVRSPSRRQWVAVSAGGTLLVSFGIGALLYHHRGDRPELNELAAVIAHEATRPIEGRLTGGFRYAPLRVPSRGPGAALPAPDITIAVANIEKNAARRDTPVNMAALGVAYLVSGQLDRAVDALTDAVRADGRAQYQSDLAAAFLARARSGGPSEDWAQALGVADRAIARDPSRSEAYFNRALALQGLHLDEEAANAWRAYSSRDPSSAWADESASRAVALDEQRRRRDATEADRTERDHQAMRERIEDALLPKWGNSFVAGDDEAAARALADAAAVADRLAQSGGDAMPRDEVQLISRTLDRHDRRAIRELAVGHQLYGTARRHYVADRQKQASDVMNDAARHLAAAASPYALWAPVLRAISLRNNGAAQAAIDELTPLLSEPVPDGYYNLRGRLAWTEGVALDALGRYDLGRGRLRRAVELFQRAGEVENVIATRTILAEAEWFLGEQASAWTNMVGVLEQVEAHRSRRDYHLVIAAIMALERDVPEAALEFQNVRVRRAASPRSRVEAYIERSRLLSRLGDDAAAGADLDRASELLTTFTDAGIRQRNRADVMIARAEVLSRTDPRRAIEQANEALDYVPRADPAIRLATLLALRATCETALNDVASARRDLLGAIDAFEQKRRLLASEHDRLQAFQQERSAVKQLIRLEVDRNGDWAEALRISERARARVVTENWKDVPGEAGDPSRTSRNLDANVAVVYFETLPDRVLAWVLTRERMSHVSLPIPASTLSVAVAGLQRVVQKGGDLEALKPYSNDLYRQVLAPVMREVAGKTTLVFVPDGPLYGVPFSAVTTAGGTPLVETFSVGVAPSFTAYLAASARLAHADLDSVVAIGDGHRPGDSDLPALPMANEEARIVGDIYPRRVVLTESAATRRQVLSQRAAVIHFAGHTVLNLQYPMFSRLLLAPDPDDERSDGLSMSDITQERFGSTRVVVLATCEGAVGRFVEGEGVISVARAFFAAGVPAVVASLWPVDDNATDLLTAFHREVRSRHDAVTALRAAQLSWLRSHGSGVPVRTWAGYVAFGGTTPSH